MSSAAPEPRRAAQTPGQECWKCGQLGHLRRDCPLMEVGQVFRVASAPATSSSPGGTYSIPVRTRGGIRHALVDTGCTQTLVHQSLVRPGALLEADWVEVKCVHGDVHRYPIVPLLLKYKGKTHRVSPVVSPRLSHPLILGTNWPGFHHLLGQYAGMQSRPLVAFSVCAALSGDAGSSDTDSGEGETAGPSWEASPAPEISPTGDFPLEQSRDDTLRSAFDQVIEIDGHVVRPEAKRTYPRFILLKNLIGPFHRSAHGYRFVLVLVDYATRYPEAVPLRNISAKSVAQSVVSGHLPSQILTDQGTSFMSRTLRELYELLGIKSIRTSVYHPQTDGLVERLNKTLKSMIHKFITEDERNWDRWLDPLLFAVREVPQASTGFSPFELLFGRKPRGVLIKESVVDFCMTCIPINLT
uniref:Integrase catalytic domain-containing protein n=1 Tax=Oreochromis niloticus TaxID=8128 RepID=A0A669B7F8_ORENI